MTKFRLYVLIDNKKHVIEHTANAVHVAITHVRNHIKKNFGKKVKIHIYDIKE